MRQEMKSNLTGGHGFYISGKWGNTTWSIPGNGSVDFESVNINVLKKLAERDSLAVNSNLAYILDQFLSDSPVTPFTGEVKRRYKIG